MRGLIAASRLIEKQEFAFRAGNLRRKMLFPAYLIDKKKEKSCAKQSLCSDVNFVRLP